MTLAHGPAKVCYMDDSEHKIPRYAMWRGQRVRVLHYAGNSNFMVLDKHDDRRMMSRSQLTFVKGKSK